jgi:hypothetical protein
LRFHPAVDSGYPDLYAFDDPDDHADSYIDSDRYPNDNSNANAHVHCHTEFARNTKSAGIFGIDGNVF